MTADEGSDSVRAVLCVAFIHYRRSGRFGQRQFESVAKTMGIAQTLLGLPECRYRRTTKSLLIGDGALGHERTGKTVTRKQWCGCDIGFSASRRSRQLRALRSDEAPAVRFSRDWFGPHELR